MSKKNKKSTRRNLHTADIEKEKAAQAERQKKLEKKNEKLSAAATIQGVQKATTEKKKKNKTIRIRKGVRINGIVIKDSESKAKALKILAAKEALKMDVEDEKDTRSSKKKVKIGGGSVKLKQAWSAKQSKINKVTKSAASGQDADKEMKEKKVKVSKSKAKKNENKMETD